VYLKVSNNLFNSPMHLSQVKAQAILLILFDKALENPNYIPVYMKVYYLFTLCLFKVGRLFSKLAIPKYMFVYVIKLSKEKAYFIYGWTWEMEHKMYCLLLTWVSVWDYFHSSVLNVNFVLWKGGVVQKYFLYAQMTYLNIII
jgi:hypothetical protein